MANRVSCSSDKYFIPRNDPVPTWRRRQAEIPISELFLRPVLHLVRYAGTVARWQVHISGRPDPKMEANILEANSHSAVQHHSRTYQFANVRDIAKTTPGRKKRSPDQQSQHR